MSSSSYPVLFFLFSTPLSAHRADLPLELALK